VAKTPALVLPHPKETLFRYYSRTVRLPQIGRDVLKKIDSPNFIYPYICRMSDQPNNPLHGITLKAVVTELHAHYGWERLHGMVKIKCFENNPSINSSLKFLRKTPWARAKVEEVYVRLLKIRAAK